MPHMCSERLLSFAVYDLSFTDDEINHLKHCPECFDRWSEFVRQVPQDVAGRYPRLGVRGV